MTGMAMTALIFVSYHVFVLLLASSAQEACKTKSSVKVQMHINVVVANVLVGEFPKSLNIF